MTPIPTGLHEPARSSITWEELVLGALISWILFLHFCIILYSLLPSDRVLPLPVALLFICWCFIEPAFFWRD
ncbi:hypothetical protein BDW75DRAFT_225448 [Aspergillus navahoensis]